MNKLPLFLGALALATACTTTAEPTDEPSAEPALADSMVEETEPEAARPDPVGDEVVPKPEVRYYLIADA